VQALVKRAEDDRDHLVIILAGEAKETEAFLAANPGFGPRFATRIPFPSYSAVELLALAETQLRARQESLTPDAPAALRRIFSEVDRLRIADSLGNGHFVRVLLDSAGQARDVRVMTRGDPRAEDLITISAADLEGAFTGLTLGLRGQPSPGDQ
jgi:hypothetical protein